jgi:hypothetical protein
MCNQPPCGGGLGPVDGDLWLMLGDSEMAGSLDNVPGDYPVGYPALNYQLWLWAEGASAWRRRYDTISDPSVGPSGFYSHYFSAAKSSRKVGTVLVARGGYQAFKWQPTAADPEPYNAIVTTVNNALVYSGSRTRMAGIILFDGANDAFFNTVDSAGGDPAKGYRASWNATIPALRAAIVGNGSPPHSAANVPVLINIATATYPTGATYVAPAIWDSLRAAQTALTGDGPNRYSYQTTDAGGYLPNWQCAHRTCQGQVALGQGWGAYAATLVT